MKETFNKNLIEFNNNITTNKEYSVYEDDKGNLAEIPTKMLKLKCNYIELEEKDYKTYLFNGIVEKDKEYNKIKVKTQIDKYQETNDKKDMGTIIDKEIEVYQVWLVANEAGAFITFNNKEEAIEYTKEYNKAINELI